MFEVVHAPLTKVSVALGSSGGAVAVSSMVDASTSFFPTTLDGWLSVLASSLAVLYSLHLLADWYWRRFWKPFLKSRGWIK